MCNLDICRICLVHGVKGEKLTKTLVLYYEELTSTTIDIRDELPKWLCFECASLLKKYHKFRDKCSNGQKVLEKILWKGQITFETVDLIDRWKEKLNSTLSYPSINNHIRTYTAKHSKHRTDKETFELDKKYGKLVYTDVNNENEKHEIKVEKYKPPIIEAIFIDKNHVNLEAKLFQTIGLVENDTEINNPEINTSYDVKDNIPNFIDLTDNKHTANVDNHDNDIDIHHNDIDNHDNGADNDNFIDNTVSSDDENIFLDIVKKAVSGENKLVFIDDIKKKKSPKSKRKRRKYSYSSLAKKSDTELLKSDAKKLRFLRQKKEYLVPEFWEQIKLSEEEAVEEFKKKEFSSKYVNAKFKCEKCLKGFSKWDILDRHIKLQHNESRGQVECRFCHLRFRMKCELGKHIATHYNVYNCLRCDMKFTNINSATLHDEYHNGVIRKCRFCGQTFAHQSTYYTHIRMAHRSEYLCTVCGDSFVSEAGIAQHKRIKHVGLTTDVPTESKEHYCEKCDVSFLTRAAYTEHLANSMMHEDQPNGKRVKRAFRVVGRKASIPTTCKHCGKHFLTASACMKHHTAEHPRLMRHLSHERHICEICGASLSAVSIASHMNTHTRAVLFACDVCGMQFTSKSSHNRHQLTHTGERPHGCPLCDKRFTQKNSMTLHYRTAHLKQPYPKRNRRKKTDEVPLVESFRDRTDDPPPAARWR